MLSDKDLKKAIKDKRISFLPKVSANQIGPASIDLKLSPHFKFFRTNKFSLIDIKQPLPQNFMDAVTLKNKEPLILHPGNFVLASTQEYLKLGNDIAMKVEGKSSLARIGLLVHTAGFVDPGFEGTLTLEISNQSNVAVTLYPDMFICQVAVYQLSSPAETPYDKRKKSLYLKQKRPTEIKTKNLF